MGSDRVESGGAPPPRAEPRLRNRWLLLTLTVAVVVAVDQLTKWWAVRSLAPPPTGRGEIVSVIGSLQFRYAENTGMAFSKGTDSGRWIALVVIVVVLVLVFLASRASNRIQVALLGVVIGGAIGNLVDRAFRAHGSPLNGAVVDFVDLQWWPVFNVADAAVVCGGILLVWFATRDPSGEDDADSPQGHDDQRDVGSSANDPRSAPGSP